MKKKKKEVPGQPKFTVKSYKEYLKERSRPSQVFKRITPAGSCVFAWMEENRDIIERELNRKDRRDENGNLVSIADMMRNLK